MPNLRIDLAQINVVVGDMVSNMWKIVACLEQEMEVTVELHQTSSESVM